MKRTVLLCAITLGLGLYLAPTVRTDDTKKKAPETRLRFVNMAKVLRDYEKGNDAGAAITEHKLELAKEIATLQARLHAAERKLLIERDEDKRLNLTRELSAVTGRLERTQEEAKDHDVNASKRAIVQVYREIRTTIIEIGEEQKVSILCCPNPSRRELDNPALAELMLQAPAAMPFHLEEGMDITDLVIERLNKRFPPKGKAKD